MKEPLRKRPVKGESEVHDYLPFFKDKGSDFFLNTINKTDREEQ